MLHIILLILKIIGIILLAVLGLLLLVLLTVLLVPLRYRVVVEHGDAFYLKGRAHWLLHLIHADVSHIDGVLHLKVRLFGFVLFDNLKPKDPKIKKTKVQKRKARTKKRSKVPEHRTKPDEHQIAGDNRAAVKDSQQVNLQDNKTEYQADAKQESIPDTLQNESKVIHKLEIEDNTDRESVNRDEVRKSEGISNKLQIIPELFHKAGKLFGKLRVLVIKLIKKLQSIRDKIKSFYNRLKDRIKGILATLTNLKRRWNLIYDFLREEINREGFHATFHSLKRLIKHILPTKLRSEIIFGTGDPCSTGQLLGVMGILYSFYGDKIRITPDFENKRMEGRHDARGRIRMATVLIIVTKLLLNKRFKQLKRNIIILKEAL